MRPDPDADPLTSAVEAYVERFGHGPPVWQFMHVMPALIREIRAAVARGEPLTAEDLYQRFDMTPPPPGVVL